MIAELENSTTKLAQSERESAWREMARQVAHEIKNPLTPMKLSVQLLERAIKDKRDDVNEMTIKVSKTLIEQIDNLTHIATQFSQFAKMGSSNIEEFNIVDILKNVVDLFGQHNPLVQVIFKSKIAETIIKADKNQCVSVFNNLVLNAIQSINDDTEGQVIVHHFIETHKCIITITDTGCGIEPDKLERIFEPNFTTKTSGTGLGLAISKTIIEGVGGSITVTSELEKGTEFRIEFRL
jgi:nitrogen fixation/metabolism regulation signal transduction histidine kinase